MSYVDFDNVVADGRETCGDWTTEAESVAAFDAALTGTGRFRIFREVSGRYMHLRPFQTDRNPRIDRIIVPNVDLIAEGWDLGPIGVECKRSRAKVGPAVSQLLDYSKAAYKINHTWILPEWFLLWPLRRPKSTVESLFSQQRLGGIYLDSAGTVVFHSGQIIAKVTADGQVDYRPNNTVSGTKTGSR